MIPRRSLIARDGQRNSLKNNAGYWTNLVSSRLGEQPQGMALRARASQPKCPSLVGNKHQERRLQKSMRSLVMRDI